MSASADPAAQEATEARPPISAYIRTLNEARQIDEIVAAALTVAREVVVVDSGSTDETKALAEAAGARVYDQPWLGNGAQKRAGEARCAHDWLLDLDADELMTPALAAEIRALFEAGEPPLSVYRLTLVTEPPIGPAWEGFALDPRAKLYDRRRHRMPDHKAWDQLTLPAETPIGALKGALLHRSFRDFEMYMAKWNRVSSARARHAKLKSKTGVILRILFAPPVYFLRHFFLRGLWRAGLYGFCIAGGVAFGRWMRDVKMYERWRGLHGGASGDQEDTER
ncbi:MAG: glycosyltransferase family 2 protein [Pseudomonadota bacterium]